jgi:hypothetical protein
MRHIILLKKADSATILVIPHSFGRGRIQSIGSLAEIDWTATSHIQQSSLQNEIAIKFQQMTL